MGSRHWLVRIIPSDNIERAITGWQGVFAISTETAMNRLAFIFPLIACFAFGCRTAAMKGTPFHSGEYENRLGPSEKRVNLWPLYYWRNPAMSFLWPVGEYADDRIAVRPLFSRYRENANCPYTETNLLWPLAHFDSAKEDYRVFPYFWGDLDNGGSYHVLFPLLWDFRHPDSGSGCNALFPLWVHDWDERKGWSETDILWPIFNREIGPHADYIRLFPFFGHSRDPSTGDGFDWVVAGLIGRYKDQQTDARWVAPFFYRDVSDGTRDDTFLLAGLAGWKRFDGQFYRSWFLPFWYRDRDDFFSLPYAHWNCSDATECTWFTPLFGIRRGTHSGSWLFPLWDWDDDTSFGGYDRSFLIIAGSSFDGWTTTTRYLFPLWWREKSGDNPDVRSYPQLVDLPSRGSIKTRLLLGLAGATHSASRKEDDQFIRYTEYRSTWFFPLWNAETWHGILSDPATGWRGSTETTERFSLLWRLYDSRHESASGDGYEYTRRRILWRLYHDETLGEDQSIDIFPGIGIDRKKDGYRKYSFFWRLFRYERDPGSGTSLDLLFLPILRP